MGIAKRRKQEFFSKHPLCCYCGGRRPATTQDHWPPRSFFWGRVWPVGYVFPACESCNRVSRIHENLFALLCRVRFDAVKVGVSEETALDEWKSIADGVAYSLPDVYRSMAMSVTEKRAQLRKLNAAPAPGQTTRDVPLMSIAHPEFGAAAKTIARKLFCSLYYLHTGRTLTADGRIAFFWRTNSQSLQAFFDENNVRPMLAMFPELRRGPNLLNDQFSYAYSIAHAEVPSAVFGVIFNHAVAMIGIALGEVANFPRILEHKEWADSLLAPYP